MIIGSGKSSGDVSGAMELSTGDSVTAGSISLEVGSSTDGD